MNYIVNSPSALVQNQNLTLSPFFENELNQFSAWTPKNDDSEIIGVGKKAKFAQNQDIIAEISNVKELTEDKFQAVDDQLAASKLNQEQISKKFKDQKELFIVGGSIMLIILIYLFFGKK